MRLGRHGTAPEVDELLHESSLTAGLDHARLEVAGPIRGPPRRPNHRRQGRRGQGRVAQLGLARRRSDAMTPILIRDDPDFDSENLLASVLFSAKIELTPIIFLVFRNLQECLDHVAVHPGEFSVFVDNRLEILLQEGAEDKAWRGPRLGGDKAWRGPRLGGVRPSFKLT